MKEQLISLDVKNSDALFHPSADGKGKEKSGRILEYSTPLGRGKGFSIERKV